MTNARIIAADRGDMQTISDLYNQIFSPPQGEEFFRRRFLGRHNVSVFLAILDEQATGFSIGFELMPSTYFAWMCGVLPDARRLGLATQLMHAIQAFAVDHNYSILRFECLNQHRPMLHVAISEGFDLVGIRWDTAGSNNEVIFEKDLRYLAGS